VKRQLAATVITLVVLAAWVPTAEAGRKADTRCDGDGCEATAGTQTEPRRGTRGKPRPPNPVTCRYRNMRLDPSFVFLRPDGSVVPTDGAGQWYERQCVDARELARINETYGGNQDEVSRILNLQQQVRAIERRPVYLRTRPDAPALAEEARSRLVFLPLTPKFAPASPWTFVNHPTALWLDGDAVAPRSATAEVPGVRVTVTATVEQVHWETGDGDTEVCAGPGRAPDPARPGDYGGCTHSWSWPSADQLGGAYQVTATVFWRVVWAAEGAPGGGDLGLVPQRSQPLAVPVAEIQILNTQPIP
jgi:hypothetical protein